MNLMPRISFLLICLSIVLFAGCGRHFQFFGGPSIQGSGNITSTNRVVGAFTKIELRSSGVINAVVGEEQKVTLTIDDNLHEIIDTRVEGSTLVIEPTSSYSSKNKLSLDIVSPSIDGAAIKGSGKFVISGVESESFNAAISGSGTIDVNGVAATSIGQISGSGTIDFLELETDSTKASVSGSGNFLINAKESIDIKISGSGNIKYKGSPKVSQSISGSGKVIQLME